MVERWRSVRIQEIMNLATYDQPDTIFNVMGFGGPCENAPVLGPDGTLALMWGGTIRLLADGLGVKLDDISETYVRAPSLQLLHPCRFAINTIIWRTMR
jgi:4-hydroxy-tetrahydrodipicolinate reductase